MTVKNQFPTISAPYRIAIIGEAPGDNEVNEGTPFVGSSGRFLNLLLSDAGIRREACFIGNISQEQPPFNDFSKFSWDGPEIQDGISLLTKDLAQYKPNLCLLLGNIPLHVAKSTAPFNYKRVAYPVSLWRGSLFLSDTSPSPFLHYKCLPTFHPSFLLRSYDYNFISRFDLRKAHTEGRTPDLVLPQRNIDISPQLNKILFRLHQIKETKCLIALDIEGGIDSMSCISIATSPTDIFIIPFSTQDGSHYWGEIAEKQIWKALASVLTDPDIPKVLQNYLYDSFVLSFSYRTPIRGLADDTMLKHWEYFCPLEKGLDFQTSIYTREPYYKSSRHAINQQEFWTYCCKDSAVTYEINTTLSLLLQKDQPSVLHYSFNRNMLAPLLYMQLRGIRFDDHKRKERIEQVHEECVPIQTRIDTSAGFPLNVKSPKAMQTYLYEVLKLPIQRTRAKRGVEGNITTNYEAILKLAYQTQNPQLYDIIKLRRLRDRASRLAFPTNKDGRVRCSYNAVGTVTGRLSCYASVTGSGTNLQTIPDDDRDIFLADDGYTFFQADLAGADGWTVAAHCAALGDPTMFDDLLAGIKIPRVIASMVKFGAEVSRLKREELLPITLQIKKDDPLYFSSKCCQHGTNYGMSARTLALTIFLQSEGDINLPPNTAELYQKLYLHRYPGIRRWHDWVEQQCYKGYLRSASGHRRPFTGRKHDHSALQAMLSHEPQNNTTFATNLACLNLWEDPDNRFVDDGLFIEPLHQVHDALCGQYPTAKHDWALSRIDKYFDNKLTIHGIEVKIPYELTYGKNWKGDK